MAKKKGKDGDTPKAKKGPDLTAQKVKKARNAFKSGGKRGLDAFLAQNADIKNHKEVEALLKKAAKLPTKPPKGKRGPKEPRHQAQVNQEHENRRNRERAQENIEVAVARLEGKTARDYQLPESERQEGQSSFGSLSNLRKAYKIDPEGTYATVMAEGGGEE